MKRENGIWRNQRTRGRSKDSIDRQVRVLKKQKSEAGDRHKCVDTYTVAGAGVSHRKGVRHFYSSFADMYLKPTVTVTSGRN